MRSKNLKAVAVRGTDSIHVADPKGFRTLLEETYGSIKSDPAVPMRIANDTAGTAEEAYQYGVLPIMNFSRASFDGVEDLFARAVRENPISGMYPASVARYPAEN